MRGREFAFATPYGIQVTTMPNNFSSFCLMVAGHRDPGFRTFIERDVPRGGVLVDAGANVGAYTLPAARHVGETGRVVAIEAHPDIFRILERNIRANGFSGVRAINAAVGDETGEVTISYTAANPGESHVAVGQEQGLRVPLFRLDDVLGREGVAAVDYLKIDVEGFESRGLLGAADTVRRSPRIAVQVELLDSHASRYASTSLTCVDLLRAAGLSPYCILLDGTAVPITDAPHGDVVWVRPDVLRP